MKVGTDLRMSDIITQQHICYRVVQKGLCPDPELGSL